MAKDGNTYAKRQRETLKRLKAEEKRNRKKMRKDIQPSLGEAVGPVGPPVTEEPATET